MFYLSRTGLTIPTGGKTYKESGEIYYSVSDLGQKLINAYVQGMRSCRKDGSVSK